MSGLTWTFRYTDQNSDAGNILRFSINSQPACSRILWVRTFLTWMFILQVLQILGIQDCQTRVIEKY